MVGLRNEYCLPKSLMARKNINIELRKRHFKSLLFSKVLYRFSYTCFYMNSVNYCPPSKIATFMTPLSSFSTLIKKEKGKHRTFLQTFMHSYSFVIFLLVTLVNRFINLLFAIFKNSYIYNYGNDNYT